MNVTRILLLILLITSCSQLKTQTELKSQADKKLYVLGHKAGLKLKDLQINLEMQKEVSKGLKHSLQNIPSMVNIDVYEQNVKYLFKTRTPNQDPKTYYVLGFLTGRELDLPELNDRAITVLNNGLIDAANGEGLSQDLLIYLPKKQKYIDPVSELKKVGQNFIDEYLKSNPNAKKTDSGLVYELIQEGDGKAPSANDIVEVHYHGTHINGEVFDSSVVRGKKISFPLNRVIRGWTEGLQLMKEGGKAKLIIPSDLAYGDVGAPPGIKGGSTLVFEVELHRVNPKEQI